MFAGRVSTLRRASASSPTPSSSCSARDDADKAAEYAAELIPVYPATREVSSWDIEKCVRIVLDTLGEVDDPLPEAVRERHGLVRARRRRCAASTGPPTWPTADARAGPG